MASLYEILVRGAPISSAEQPVPVAGLETETF